MGRPIFPHRRPACESPPRPPRPSAQQPTCSRWRSGSPSSLTGAAAAVDRALGGTLTRLVEAGEIRGAKGQVTVVHADGGVRAKRVAVVGLGKTPGPAEVRLAAAGGGAGGRRRTGEVRGLRARRRAARARRGDAVRGRRGRARRLPLHPVPDRAADDRPGEVGSLAVLGGDRAQARLSAVLTEATNRARDLQNTPPRDMGPQELAERARELAKQHPTLTVARPRPGLDGAARDGPLPGRGAGVVEAAAHDRPSPQAAQGEGRRRPRPRRQGAHVRLGRLHAEAGAGPGRDEVRHVGRRGGARDDRRHRRARASRSRSSR